jgi:hypothetical protein
MDVAAPSWAAAVRGIDSCGSGIFPSNTVIFVAERITLEHEFYIFT